MGMEGKFPPPLFFVSLVFFPQPNSRKYHFPLYFPLPIFHPPYFHPTKHTLRVCLFGGEKMVDGKLLRENGKENFFGVCLVEWGGMKINSRAWVFSLQAHQKFSPKNGEKTERRKWGYLLDKNAHMQFVKFLFFFFSFFCAFMGSCLFLFLFSFFLFLISWAVGVMVVLFCLTRHDFFGDMIFIF